MAYSLVVVKSPEAVALSMGRDPMSMLNVEKPPPPCRFAPVECGDEFLVIQPVLTVVTFLQI